MHEHTQPRRISKAQRAAHAARVADARRVCDELIADLKGQPAIEVLARNQRLSIAFGWCVQAHRYAEAALVLIDAGMEHESQVLQRQLLEFTLYLKWLRSRGDAATEAVLVEHKRTIGNLASDAMGGPLELPQDYLDFVDGMDVSPVDEDDRFQKVQSLCREMGYINDLYALYRWLSGIAHPSLAAAAPYLVDDSNGKPPWCGIPIHTTETAS